MKLRALLAALTLSALLVGLPALSQESTATNDDAADPKQTDLVEQTERRLVQLDVTVRGPREAISNLTNEDFELAVGGRAVESFLLDNLCRLPGDDELKTGRIEIADEQPTTEQPAVPAVPTKAPVNYLFYLDMHHLTMEGRQNAIDISRELVEDLVVDGNKAMIVSAGKELKTFAELTDDPSELLAALTLIEGDRNQFDPTVMEQDNNIADVLDELNRNNMQLALSRAREFAREEAWRTERALRLFSMVLGRMADFNPPKAVIYFADTMRSNAGDHYLSFFGTKGLDDKRTDTQGVNTFAAHHAFDEVINEATAMGIRMYTVQAQGLVAELPNGPRSSARAGFSSPTANFQPVRHAQDSLTGLAVETGGQTFLNGVRASKIAESIRTDLSCVYLLSFDAGRLDEDQGHRVVLRTLKPKVKTQVRGKIVVQSESRRLTSRLLAAFGGPGSSQPEFPVRGKVVPLDFEDGEYRALVQVSVPGSPLPSTTWDMGVSLVSRGAVREDASGRVAVTGPGMQVVFETEMTFKPGPYELVTVAHEVTGDDIATGRIEGEWPDPNDATVTLGPIAVMQPVSGAVLRDEELRGSGSLGLAKGELGRTDHPTAVVGIVCRNKAKKRGLTIERRLIGDSSAEFEPQPLEFEGERCAQFRDVIPAGTMTTGRFAYEVRAFEKGKEVATALRHFDVAHPDEHPGLAASSGSL